MAIEQVEASAGETRHPFIPCRKGPSKDDAALAFRIRGKLKGKLRGALNSNRIGCARQVVNTIKASRLPQRANRKLENSNAAWASSCLDAGGRTMKMIYGALTVAVVLALTLIPPHPAWAWGNEGHEIVVLIAQAHLNPVARQKVNALLAADTDPLTAHDIAPEATWADALRDANEHGAREKTRQWHFVDIELAAPDLDQACFGHPQVPSGRPASDGPAQDCVVDKIQEFAAELADPDTGSEEQIVALKFLLHFIGDLHQPLHASDDHDRGGNDKRVSAPGFKAGNLHHYWDTEFVDQLGPNAKSIASDLIGHISEAQVQAWSQGGPADWAAESFKLAKDDAYGQLPEPSAQGSFRLSDDYIAMATRDVAEQLSKAGVRLALQLHIAHVRLSRTTFCGYLRHFPLNMPS